MLPYLLFGLRSWPGWRAVLLVLLLLTAASGSEPTVGLTRTRPRHVRFVETPRGYMIPYEMEIPGTQTSFTMVPIAGGRFRLGSPAGEAGRRPHEGPQVELTLEPYWIGQCEVTWGEYQHYYDLRIAFARFDDLGIRRVTAANRSDAVTAPSWIYDPPGRLPADKDETRWPRHPAVSMTQYGAKQYTKWLSKLTGQFYRLPSEAEWECACRAGSTAAFHFGEDPARLGEYAWYFGNSAEGTHPVRLKKPNAWGLYDMHGNAAEWVLDQFDEGGYARLRASVAAGAAPLGWPTALHPRTVRGGSWDDDPRQCRSASRLASSVNWQDDDANVPPSPWWLAAAIQRQIGFRIARPLQPPADDQQARYWEADVKELRDAVASCLVYENRGAVGLVDPELPAAVRQASP